jgi:hypothetical protein
LVLLFFTDTVVIDTVDGKHVAAIVPAGSVIKAASGPKHGDRMVDVLWNGRIVAMFAVDVDVRGTEVTGD